MQTSADSNRRSSRVRALLCILVALQLVYMGEGATLNENVVANAGCELGADVTYTEPTCWAWAPALDNDTGYVACQDRTIAPFSGTGGQRYFTVAARPDRPNTTSDSSISVQQLIQLEFVAGTLSLVDADRLGFSAAALLSSPSTVADFPADLRRQCLRGARHDPADIGERLDSICYRRHRDGMRAGAHSRSACGPSLLDAVHDEWGGGRHHTPFFTMSTSRPVPPALAPTHESVGTRRWRGGATA
jgi:hypothetical protein